MALTNDCIAQQFFHPGVAEEIWRCPPKYTGFLLARRGDSVIKLVPNTPTARSFGRQLLSPYAQALAGAAPASQSSRHFQTRRAIA
jgi:hypothetical protein